MSRMVTHHSSAWTTTENVPFQIETQPAWNSSIKSESLDLDSESMVEWKNIFSMRQMNLATLAARQSGIRENSAKAQKIRSRYIMSATKSLDILRQNLQSALNDDIDNVIKSYLEKFFAPAVTNIRVNLGNASVKEEHIREVCRTILENAKLMYANNPVSKGRCTQSDVSHLIECRFSKNYLLERRERHERREKRERLEKQEPNLTLKSKAEEPSSLNTPLNGGMNSPLNSALNNVLNNPLNNNLNNGLSSSLSHPINSTLSNALNPTMSNDSLNSSLNNSLSNPLNNSMSDSISDSLNDPLSDSLNEPLNNSLKLEMYESPVSNKPLFSLSSPLDSESKWSPHRIRPNTLFVISPCNAKDIGVDSEVLLQHPELFRYTVDQEDLDWLVIQKQIMLPLDSILSINLVLLDDLIELALTEQYRNNPFCSLNELKGFELPEFMLNKVRTCLSYSNPISIEDNENPLEINATLNLAIDYITAAMTPPFSNLDSELSTPIESFDFLDSLPQASWDSNFTSPPLADSHSTLSALLSGQIIPPLNN